MDVVAGVILFVMVVYGLLGLIAPKVLMRAGRSVPGRSSSSARSRTRIALPTWAICAPVSRLSAPDC